MKNQVAHFKSKEYRKFIDDIKSRIQAARIKASLSVNAELIHLYLDIGQSVVERQKKDGWGASIIEQMSRDIQKDFPGIEGFSASNISRMRAFYLAWKDSSSISAQAVPKMSDFLSRIPWGHHVVLLFKIKDYSERFWYLKNHPPHLIPRNTKGEYHEITKINPIKRLRLFTTRLLFCHHLCPGPQGMVW